MGSLEEIYWNMAKKTMESWSTLCYHALIVMVIISLTMRYISASSLCSHNMPSCSHVIFMCSYLYLIVCQRDKLFIVVSVTYV